jgi:hypothetical protein
MRETLLLDVPHRQGVFTIPRRLRVFFKFKRRLLGDLCRCAVRALLFYFQAAAGTALEPGVILIVNIIWHFFYTVFTKRGRKYSSIVIKRGDLWAGTAIQHAPEKGKSYKDTCGRWRKLVCDGCITSSLDRHYEYGLVCSWAAAQEKRINSPATFTSILSSRVQNSHLGRSGKFHLFNEMDFYGIVYEQ